MPPHVYQGILGHKQQNESTYTRIKAFMVPNMALNFLSAVKLHPPRHREQTPAAEMPPCTNQIEAYMTPNIALGFPSAVRVHLAQYINTSAQQKRPRARIRSQGIHNSKNAFVRQSNRGKKYRSTWRGISYQKPIFAYGPRTQTPT